MLIDKLGLVGDPLLLHIQELALQLLSLLLQVAQLVLQRSTVLVVIAVFAELSQLPVKLVHLQLLLSNLHLVLLLQAFLLLDLLLFGGTLLLKFV